ncbi:MAG: hypothetical protein LUC37_02155 [Prevotella sp.]|nr:hypothetical protein [Prevotella sp.]
MNMCKNCITLHVDNFEPKTYTWILEDLDYPYVEPEWIRLRDRAYAVSQSPLSGTSVLGRYVSLMNLNQYRGYSWADTELLMKVWREKHQNEKIITIADEMKAKRDYEAGFISEAEYRTLTSSSFQAQNESAGTLTADYGKPPDSANFYNEKEYLLPKEVPNPAESLTEEDKQYLALKWGRLYKANEWIELEKKYNEMMESFDITDSDSIGALVLICKTYLKMNQAVDCGDMDSYRKLSAVYDSLRKSAKFTAAQNKEQKVNCISSIGELVVLCEREGFIPRFATDIPQDKVDATLKDMNAYTYKLVTQDLGFGQQIEDALRRIEQQKAADAAAEEV